MGKASLTTSELNTAVKAYFTEEQYEKYGALVCNERAPKLCFWAAFAGPFWFLFHRMYLHATLLFLAFHWGHKGLIVFAKKGMLSFMQAEIINIIVFAYLSARIAEPMLKKFVIKRILQLWHSENHDYESFLIYLKSTKSSVNQRMVSVIVGVVVVIMMMLVFYIYQVNPRVFMQALQRSASELGM